MIINGTPAGLEIKEYDRSVPQPKTFTAEIFNAEGECTFRQEDVEAPETWSQQAVNIVASKYFRGTLGTDDRETCVYGMVKRVVNEISQYGIMNGYFKTAKDASTFGRNLNTMLLNQEFSFNSPVWFNVGAVEDPQCSACFINSVEDSMESILDLAKTEGMLFKHGSGTGTNLSVLRSSKEKLRGGGTASGPVSFMKGFDSFAGVIKSGGKTRRAAKMVMLDVTHPDIEEFITCKASEERKAHALIDAGYDGNFNVPGGAYDSVQFQNANNSVRVTDEFMRAYKNDEPYTLYGKDGYTEKRNGFKIMDMIADAAWECGDPGVQFHDTINKWHTCPHVDEIKGSNPCSEYMFLDDTACNLASINLCKVNPVDDYARFLNVVHTVIVAMDIIVGMSSYPTKKIEVNSHKYRPLGLGYANLGGLLMEKGLGYGTKEGREMAAFITSMMGAQATVASIQVGLVKGPYAAINKEYTLEVHNQHRASSRGKHYKFNHGADPWDGVVLSMEQGNFPRNAQLTVLAPTGTIGFMMDCATTGIEPELALVKYKRLVGGGYMKLVNDKVPKALDSLGYNDAQIESIVQHIDETGTIEGSALKDKHLPVFDCAFKPEKGERSLAPEDHILMMAAVQPFLSGAISKTVNVPEHITVGEIRKLIVLAHEEGLKSIAFYRDNCKRSQPLSVSDKKHDVEFEPLTINGDIHIKTPGRRRLPADRASFTHKFSISGHEGYITAGVFEDGTPGELFIRMSKEGSTLGGLMDAFATSISLNLQHGVPLESLVTKFRNTRFEPSGFTGDEHIRSCTSLIDYIMQWLEKKFPPVVRVPLAELEKPKSKLKDAIITHIAAVPEEQALDPHARVYFSKKAPVGIPALDASAPPCFACGSMMVRNGACYKCTNCGETSGCS